MYIYIYCITDADNFHWIEIQIWRQLKKTKKVLSLLINSNKLDFLLGFFSFSWPLDRLVEDEGLFFTRPKHLKTSRAVKKSIAAGFVNNLRHVSHNTATRKGKEQADWNDHRLWPLDRVLTLLILSQILRLKIMAVVMYRFETYVKDIKTLKETRSGSYF